MFLHAMTRQSCRVLMKTNMWQTEILKQEQCTALALNILIVREASLALFNSLDAADFDKTGTANQTKYSVRHMLYFCIVHQRHHFNIIRERYYQ